MKPKTKRWKFPIFYKEKAEDISRATGLHPMICQILINRGVENPSDIKNFLNPDIRNIPDPFLLKDMSNAVERILCAIEKGEKILIFGDYDVDGITASALLYEFLKCHGAEVLVRLPNRMSEGYGLTPKVVKEAHEEGVELLITVDCGITDSAASERAHLLKIDLIITDHHHPPDKLPQALAIINPKQNGCPYPYKDLAGVGVALKMAQALTLSRQGRQRGINQKGFWLPALNEYLDLVCLGTIADIMPLTGENRILVKYGLEAIKNTKRPGLTALMEIAGINGQEMTTGLVAFGLAPRINATGRICSPEEGFHLLCTKSYEEGKKLANFLNIQNQKRRQMEEKILAEAREKIQDDPHFIGKKIIVLADEDWHPGVIGIVAQKLVEEFYLPAILISIQDGIGKGSARSIPQIHLYELLTQCQEILKDYGGHAAAAGITIEEGHICNFSDMINTIMTDRNTQEDILPELIIDSEINGCPINEKLIDEINNLGPFGCGNPEPILCLKGLYLASTPLILKDAHLKLSFKEGSLIHEAIGFNMRPLWEELTASYTTTWDIAFCPQINSWQGRKKIQLRLKDIKGHAPDYRHNGSGELIHP